MKPTTGILKIMEAYPEPEKEPQIETSDNAFKITLPNLNAHTDPNEPGADRTAAVRKKR